MFLVLCALCLVLGSWFLVHAARSVSDREAFQQSMISERQFRLAVFTGYRLRPTLRFL